MHIVSSTQPEDYQPLHAVDDFVTVRPTREWLDIAAGRAAIVRIRERIIGNRHAGIAPGRHREDQS